MGYRPPMMPGMPPPMGMPPAMPGAPGMVPTAPPGALPPLMHGPPGEGLLCCWRELPLHCGAGVAAWLCNQHPLACQINHLKLALLRGRTCSAVGGVPTAPPGAHAAAPPPRLPGGQPPRSTTCWVGRIAPTVQSDFVQQLLEACGPVTEWKPVTEPETGKLKGFGFVTFAEPEGVVQALQVLHDLRVDGQQLAVKCNKVGAAHRGGKAGQATTAVGRCWGRTP